jgi:hypothetical protein
MVIVKGFQVQSRKGKNLGFSKTMPGAKRRLAQVEHFKGQGIGDIFKLAKNIPFGKIANLFKGVAKKVPLKKIGSFTKSAVKKVGKVALHTAPIAATIAMDSFQPGTQARLAGTPKDEDVWHDAEGRRRKKRHAHHMIHANNMKKGAGIGSLSSVFGRFGKAFVRSGIPTFKAIAKDVTHQIPSFGAVKTAVNTASNTISKSGLHKALTRPENANVLPKSINSLVKANPKAVDKALSLASLIGVNSGKTLKAAVNAPGKLKKAALAAAAIGTTGYIGNKLIDKKIKDSDKQSQAKAIAAEILKQQKHAGMGFRRAKRSAVPSRYFRKHY